MKPRLFIILAALSAAILLPYHLKSGEPADDDTATATATVTATATATTTATATATATSVAAEDNSSCPFEVGEKATYTVTMAGIPAGTVVMETLPLVEINDRKAFRIQIKARSYAAFDKIYHVANDIETLIDTKTYLPYFYRKKLEQGDKKRFQHIAFDRKKLTATLYKTDKKGKIRKRTTSKIKADTHDPMSCFFYFRTKKLKVGTSFDIPTFTGKNIYNIRVKVVKKERKKIPGVWAGMTYHIVPEYSFEGIFLHNGRVDIWVEEKTKIPVIMEFQLPVGFITVELENVEYVDYKKKKETPGDAEEK